MKKQLNQALFASLLIGCPFLVSQALHKGARVNALDEEGNTPLLKSFLNNKFGVVEILLRHGADPRIVNNKGVSCLIVLKKKKNSATLSFEKDFYNQMIAKIKPLLMEGPKKACSMFESDVQEEGKNAFQKGNSDEIFKRKVCSSETKKVGGCSHQNEG